MQQEHTNTIIIGAGPAGLACAACLHKKGVPYLLLEQSGNVGNSWHHHYDRLHLHTHKKVSALPYLSFSKESPKYISRDAFIQYLHLYTHHFGIKPLLQQKVKKVFQQDDEWQVTTEEGKTFTSKNVVIATGNTAVPRWIEWPGMANFKGSMVHSREYKNGKVYSGKKVLVIGFGNSACEIAIDLYEHGALPTLSVRSPVNIIPRDIKGISVSKVGAGSGWLAKNFPQVADVFNKPVLGLAVGHYKKYGLQQLPYGPAVQTVKYGTSSMIDTGTLALIKSGHIAVRPGIKAFTTEGVQFTNGSSERFDAVVMATGYTTSLQNILHDTSSLLNERGRPLVSGKESAQKGLYFCGFYVSPVGMLYEISGEAKKIAAHISQKK